MRNDEDDDGHAQQSDPTAVRHELNARAAAPQNFTLRGILVGLLFGVVICFSNVYFGLQTVSINNPVAGRH